MSEYDPQAWEAHWVTNMKSDYKLIWQKAWKDFAECYLEVVIKNLQYQFQDYNEVQVAANEGFIHIFNKRKEIRSITIEQVRKFWERSAKGFILDDLKPKPIDPIDGAENELPSDDKNILDQLIENGWLVDFLQFTKETFQEWVQVAIKERFINGTKVEDIAVIVRREPAHVSHELWRAKPKIIAWLDQRSRDLSPTNSPTADAPTKGLATNDSPTK